MITRGSLPMLPDEIQPRCDGRDRERIGRAETNRARLTVIFLKEELHTILEIIVQRDLGQRGINKDLQRRLINAREDLHDLFVVSFRSSDEELVIAFIRRNPHQIRISLRAPYARRLFSRSIIRSRRERWCAL